MNVEGIGRCSGQAHQNDYTDKKRSRKIRVGKIRNMERKKKGKIV